MPRGPSGSYTYPDGTRGLSGQTIYSARYNTFLDDLALTLNTALPLNMGGTGGTSAMAARTNLLVDVSTEGQTVTNYDSHVWLSGSFQSVAGAINSPDGPGAATNSYFGTVQAISNPDFVTIEVRNIVTGAKYMRKKHNGVWSGWTGSSNVTSGSNENALLVLNRSTPPGTNASAVISQVAGVERWVLYLGDNSPETGSNAGSNFKITRLSDGGALLGNSMEINRATGEIVFQPNIRISGHLGDPNQSAIYMNAAKTRYLAYDGTTYQFGGAIVGASNGRLWGASDGTPIFTAGGTITGSLLVASGMTVQPQITIQATGGSPHPILNFNNSGGLNIAQVGFSTSASEIQIIHMGIPAAPLCITPSGQIKGSHGYMVKAGMAGGYNPADAFNFFWTGALQAWINTTNVGNVTLTSDYRTKKDVIELPSMWERVKALRPISYTQAEFNPPGSTSAEPMFKEDDIVRFGFIAHELQEQLIPSAATGVKDDPVNVQSPNWPHIVAALTKAVQEAMARIERLEEMIK